MPPTALDLFCGAGSASYGLALAGFHVTGIDINPQPEFPAHHFIQDDIRNLTPDFVNQFDLVWASPPCQSSSRANSYRAATKHLNLIPFTQSLIATHPVSIIENVPDAARLGFLRNDIELQFQAFIPNAPFPRRRIFQLSFPPPTIHIPNWLQNSSREYLLQPTSFLISSRTYKYRRARNLPTNKLTLANELRQAFQAHWISSPDENPHKKLDLYRLELANMIPFQYAEFLGRHALLHINGIPYPHQQAMIF